ncbi:hypothetical protein K3152_02445 [Qipengyuania sp. 1NDH17]|uniref:Uncharacterized protein n=1 Tax=Qipengyuania polymorpha TaxID=2867234 RepID=A0ABS7IVZ5_9SPHN|nr:hypothetical protein [Qipengyuania polymorpha]MBX7457094.1 hypothetical protein [Qipengyuania polymorpha]
MKTDSDRWQVLAQHLGIRTIAPFELELSDSIFRFAALLPQFGATNGMVVDADWSLIAPHQSSLLAAGYGFSCVQPSDQPDDLVAVCEILSDWGWTCASPKPDWLRA